MCCLFIPSTLTAYSIDFITIPVPARWVFCPLTYHVRASWSLRVQRLSPRNHVIQHFSRGPNNEVTKADGLLCENVPLRNWFRVITSAFVLRTDEVGRLRAFNLKSFFFLLPRLPNYTFGTSVRTSQSFLQDTSHFSKKWCTVPSDASANWRHSSWMEVHLTSCLFSWYRRKFIRNQPRLPQTWFIRPNNGTTI